MSDKNLQEERSSFVDALQDLAYGTTVMGLDRKLKKCVEASQKTGKVSTLTLTLKIKPILGADEMQYEIHDSCKASIPETDNGATIMFSNEEHDLSVEHPAVVAKKQRLAAQAEKRAGNVRSIDGAKS